MVPNNYKPQFFWTKEKSFHFGKLDRGCALKVAVPASLRAWRLCADDVVTLAEQR